MKKPYQPYWYSQFHHPLIYLCMALSKNVREEIKYFESCEKDSGVFKQELEELIENPDSEKSQEIKRYRRKIDLTALLYHR